MNIEQFLDALGREGINLSPQQIKQFEDYYDLLVTTNEHVNLTTITEKPNVYLKHFYDSITPAFFVKDIQTEALTLCDVGAGAGFPSIPLKIVFPNLKVTIVDSLNKRINFLQTLVDQLQLTDVTLVHSRAEEFGNKNSAARQSFDLVTARAVARLSVLSELCLPLVKVGGKMIALKASKAGDELDEGRFAIGTLGGKVAEDFAFELPISKEPRHIIVIDKVKDTPKKYPRKPGTPNKEPLSNAKK